MHNSITVRLPEDLAKWLDHNARKTGVSKSRIVRAAIEEARNPRERPFLRLAGAIVGPRELSMGEGFCR